MTFPCMITKSPYHSKLQAVKNALQNHLENPISDNQFKLRKSRIGQLQNKEE